MSDYKTHAEMVSSAEFIAYLERLRSGSLADNLGVNRTLERLSQNADAVVEALQCARTIFLETTGVLSFNGSFGWTSRIDIYFAGIDGTVYKNKFVNGASPYGPLVSGNVLYTILDREVQDKFVGPYTASDFAAYLTEVSDKPNRLDYQVIGFVTTYGITLIDGRRISYGSSYAAGGYRNNLYALQSEFEPLAVEIRENAQILITGGGDLRWDADINTLSWSDDLIVQFPASGGNNTIAAGSVTIGQDQTAYIELSREPVGSVATSISAVATGYMPQDPDNYVFAIRMADSRLYLRNGQSLTDGEFTQWGSVRTGVQWIFKKLGFGTKVVDFKFGGAYPGNTYRVGAGELMLYQNGLKMQTSDAYWVGSYPTGSLVGTIGPWDHYIEEDSDNGRGSRVIWLTTTAPAPYHSPGSYDANYDAPNGMDWLEAFIGTQGLGPSPVESIGIYGNVAEALQTDVKLEEGTNIDLTYNPSNNSIVISADINAGVASLKVSTDITSKTGALSLVPSNTVAIEMTYDGFSWEIAAPYKAGLVNSTIPSNVNPYATYKDFDYISGFDVVWSTDLNSQIRTVGGVLRTGGVSYVSNDMSFNNGEIIFTASNLKSGEGAIVNNSWYYAYLYEGSVAGYKPRGYLSKYPPEGATGVGQHRSATTAKFLTSVYIGATGKVTSFVKHGSWVELMGPVQIKTAFLGFLFNGTYQAVDLTGLYLPKGVKHFKATIACTINTTTLPVGDYASIGLRSANALHAKSFVCARVSGTPIVFFEDVSFFLDAANKIYMLANSDIVSINSLAVTGYAEGRFSVAMDM